MGPGLSRSSGAGYDGVGILRVGVGRLRVPLVLAILADLVGVALLDVLVVAVLVVPVEGLEWCLVMRSCTR